MTPSLKALKAAQHRLTEPGVDRVLILPQGKPRTLGMAIPKGEGTTAVVTCADLGRDDWYILTRDDIVAS